MAESFILLAFFVPPPTIKTYKYSYIWSAFVKGRQLVIP